jgi:hypothetical protein
MTTEGHARDGKKIHQQLENTARDKELVEIRARMDELALRMQQNAKSRWVYEWPMKTKIKWPVRALMAKRQQRLLRIWLRHAENLNRPEKKMVQVCEPEDGRNLSSEDDMGSAEDLKDCQEEGERSQKFPISRRAMR